MIWHCDSLIVTMTVLPCMLQSLLKPAASEHFIAGQAFMLMAWQVTFYSVAEMRQHNDGPTHRKAVAKDAAMRERDARLGAQASAAAEAVVSLILLCRHVVGVVLM